MIVRAPVVRDRLGKAQDERERGARRVGSVETGTTRRIETLPTPPIIYKL
jgi:hypothetical protein